IIKRQFGFVKARYKGLLKNDNQLAMLFTLANLFRVDQMIRQWGSRDFPSKNDKVLWRPRRPWPPEGYYFSLTGKYPSIERISS
ncbi:hypothetical protein N8Q31_26110, partial [Enterobacter hormaechei subsp. xiangfangensis]|nr:hypothetical protein [Enterobacter hormaechei subsp. xiangfangensis]